VNRADDNSDETIQIQYDQMYNSIQDLNPEFTEGRIEIQILRQDRLLWTEMMNRPRLSGNQPSTITEEDWRGMTRQEQTFFLSIVRRDGHRFDDIYRYTNAPVVRVARAPRHVQRQMMPKHIADQIWLLNEPECMICLMPTTEDTYALSMCGHDYCKKCLTDSRLRQCGSCRINF